MRNLFIGIEVVISVGLIASILIQSKGTGLSASFGGGGEFYQSRRGVEKFVTYATVGLAFSFGLVSVVLLLIP